ncbi:MULTISPECIES: ABC transporter substrate-binding protein [Vibrio]|uniref:Taurine-binding protein n=1 Tax=Vibrio bivalvicida TaxID=1276888 RepID=A0A177Y2X6_9VIBR|nr:MULTISPECIES: ABC transporter substrate-binding protein [Vibrio]KLN63441.1 taurine-binding protein [Vibrio sp. VPAP30]OAJ95167.1 taurine-binding protein [Vibrio bivalvicida]
MPVFKSKKLALVVSVLLLCTTVVSVIIGTKSKARPSSSQIKIGVSLTPLSSPFLIAEQLGLFKHFDLDVTLYPCSSGVACTQLMLDRSVDYATASESVVMFQSFARDDVSLLVSFVESDNDLKLLTLNPVNIQNVSDLDGKRVGIVKGTASEFYFDSVLISNSAQQIEIEKIYLQPHELVPALLSYRVEAISAWEPMGFEADLLSVAEVSNLGNKGVYQLSYNLITRAPYLEFVGDEPVRLLRALDMAIEWINNNPDRALSIIAQRLDIPLSQVEWSWDDYLFRLSLGNSLLSNLQLQSRWAIENGLVANSPPDFREVFYTYPYQQAVSLRD